jgi:hypothetical protein
MKALVAVEARVVEADRGFHDAGSREMTTR